MSDQNYDFELSESWYENKPLRRGNDLFSEKNRHARAHEYEAVRFSYQDPLGAAMDCCFRSLIWLAVGLLSVLIFINL